MYKVAILGKQQPLSVRRDIQAYLASQGLEARILDMETRNAADWVDQLEGYHAIISAGEKFPGQVFARLQGQLRLLSRYGVGTDEIDKTAAANAGVAVCNAAGTLSTAVAECAMGLILCLLRNLPEADREVRNHDWSRFFESKTGTQLEGKTVGLIGFGDIAKALAKMLSGFDCRVMACDPNWDAQAADRLQVTCADASAIRREADIVSLHVPLTPATAGMVNQAFLAEMKPTALLINTARGKLVVSEDLAQALKQGVIAGAGLDVFDPEPPRPDDPLLTAPHTVLLPHAGACTMECHRRAGMTAAAHVADFFAGREVGTILNPDYRHHLTGGAL